MPTKELNEMADEVIALLQGEPSESDINTAKRLMNDWPPELRTLRAGLYESIERDENDTL